MNMAALLRRFSADRSGATAIEYGLIIALMFLVALGAMQAVGTATTDKWEEASDAIVGAQSGG